LAIKSAFSGLCNPGAFLSSTIGGAAVPGYPHQPILSDLIRPAREQGIFWEIFERLGTSQIIL